MPAYAPVPLLPNRGRVFRVESAKAGQCLGTVMEAAKSAICLKVGVAMARSERASEAHRGLYQPSEATYASLLRLPQLGMGSFECG